MKYGARDGAKERAGNRAEAPRADDDHCSITATREFHDLLGRVALEDLLVCLHSLFVQEFPGAIERDARVCHLLAQRFLIVRLTKCPKRRPNEDEYGPRAEGFRERRACSNGALGRI